MPFIESFEEFTKRQGCDFVRLENGSIIFANGASCVVNSVDDRALTNRREPPGDPGELLRLQQYYWRACVKQEEAAFERASAEYTQTADYAARFPGVVPPLPEACLESLRAGCKRLGALKRKLARVEAEVAELPSELARREEHERQAKLQAARRETLLSVVCLGSEIEPPPPVPQPLPDDDVLGKLFAKPKPPTWIGSTSKGGNDQ